MLEAQKSISDFEITINEEPGGEGGALFNTFRFFNLHKTERSYYIAIKDKNSHATLGTFSCREMEEHVVRSPLRGTFGGFELYYLNVNFIEVFIDYVEGFLAKQGMRKLVIIETPLAHNPPKAALILHVLIRRGYRIDYTDLDYFIDIDPTSLVDKMEPNNKKRFRKCKREGFEAFHLERQQYRQAYDVICQNRISKGYPLSMRYEEILQMLEMFPDCIHFFGVFRNKEMIASSICVKINRDILYVFYWGDLPAYAQYSPITLLAEFIYSFARDNNFKMLDLGSSSEKGNPNYGLTRFKRNLGALETLKITYSKTLK